MAFENDPEGYKIAVYYAGQDFDKARIVTHEVLCEYDGSWSLKEFQELIARCIYAIPIAYRETTEVRMYDPGYDGSVSLRMSYVGPENASVVAGRIKMCEYYVDERRQNERATYEALKKKFG